MRLTEGCGLATECLFESLEVCESRCNGGGHVANRCESSQNGCCPDKVTTRKDDGSCDSKSSSCTHGSLTHATCSCTCNNIRLRNFCWRNFRVLNFYIKFFSSLTLYSFNTCMLEVAFCLLPLM